MSKSLRSCPIAMVVAGVFTLHASGPAKGTQTLSPGDVAPPFIVDKWLKGEAIPSLEKGKVYVLDFWATWCGPCADAMPHLTRLQDKYADQGVVFIGINVWERDRASVEPFMQQLGDQIGYAVATDVIAAEGAEGRMAETWMKASGRDAIPASFIVDREGRIAWIGHPRRIDRPLRLVLAGTFDVAAEAETERKRLADEEIVSTLLRDKGLAEAMDEALAAIDRLITLEEGALTTPIADITEPYGLLKLKVLMAKGDYAAANALAAELEQVLSENEDDLHRVLNVMAWAPDLKQLDTDLMLRLTKRVTEQARGEDWKASRMLARIYAARHQYDQAIEAQRRALAGAPTRDKPWEEARLKLYMLDELEAQDSTEHVSEPKAENDRNLATTTQTAE